MGDCPKCGTSGWHEQVRVDLEGRIQIQHGCKNENCQNLWLEDARDEWAVLNLALKWAGFPPMSEYAFDGTNDPLPGVMQMHSRVMHDYCGNVTQATPCRSGWDIVIGHEWAIYLILVILALPFLFRLLHTDRGA